MNVLKSIRTVFAYLGYLPGKGIFKNKFSNKIASLINLMLVLTFEFTSLIYMVGHLKIGDIENSLYAGFQAAALLPAIGSFSTLMYHKRKIWKILDSFQRIFDHIVCGNKPTAIFFIRIEKMCEKLPKYAFLSLSGGFFGCSLLFAILGAIFYTMRDGHIEPGNLFLPIKLR